MRKRKFPKDVARFFNPHKSGTNAKYNEKGVLASLGTHQREKSKERSYIPVYQGWLPAMATTDPKGRKIYVARSR